MKLVKLRERVAVLLPPPLQMKLIYAWIAIVWHSEGICCVVVQLRASLLIRQMQQPIHLGSSAIVPISHREMNMYRIWFSYSMRCTFSGERCTIVSDDTRRGCDFSASSGRSCETSIVSWRCTNAHRIDVADKLRKQSHQPSSETESVSQVRANQSCSNVGRWRAAITAIYSSFSFRAHL